MASYCAGVVCSNESRCMTAAELTSTSSPPSWPATRRGSSAAASASVRSAAKQAAFPPACRISSMQLGRTGGRRVVVDGEGHPAAGQRPGELPAEPSTGPRHQGDPAAQLHQPWPRGAIGRIWPVGASGPEPASESTPRVRSSIST